MSVNKSCAELMARSKEFGPLYGDRLANHLPMALVALDRLGATAERQAEFYAKYSRRLKPSIDQGEEQSVSIVEALGQRDKYPGCLRYCAALVADMGREQTVAETLPLLLPGIAASAFHALIRLAYGLEAESDHEVASALAYWATEFQPFKTQLVAGETGFAELLVRKMDELAGHEYGPGIIVDRMDEADGLIAGEGELAVEIPCVTTMTAASLDAFCAQAHFTLLHAVTASHAARLVAPYAKDEAGFNRHFCLALLLAAVSTGLRGPSGGAIPPLIEYSWEAMHAFARRSDNDHVVKLVYSSWQQFEIFGDERYRYLAARALRLI